jgi:DNA polymerase-3 subunit gamma/tau
MTYEIEALEYIAKLCDGGMRDSLTCLDKCLSFSNELTLENVVNALGTVNYEDMMALTGAVFESATEDAVKIVEELYASGKDIKQFVKLYMHFLLDVSKFSLGCDWKYLNVPKLKEIEEWMSSADLTTILDLLDMIVRLDSTIKYSSTPKQDIEAELILFINGAE